MLVKHLHRDGNLLIALLLDGDFHIAVLLKGIRGDRLRVAGCGYRYQTTYHHRRGRPARKSRIKNR